MGRSNGSLDFLNEEVRLALTSGKRRKRWWIVALILVAVAALLLLRPGAQAQYAQAQVTTGDISTEFSFTGNITAPRRQVIMSEAPATIKDVYVSANQTVQSGERLLKLSTGELIKSDIAGEVVSLDVQQDDVVAAGATLLTIVDVHRLEVDISIDEYDVAAVSIGKPVQVTVNALEQQCEGKVKSFNKEASTTGTLSTYTAVISIDAPQGVLPGMQVEVRMVDKAATGATLIKVEALQFDEQNRPFVLISDGQKGYGRVYVETGINNGTEVQILSGLTSGQTVYYTPTVTDMRLLMMRMGGGQQ